MRLISFRIKNFKSIIDTGVCHLSATDNILVLAGQNEAGKSAVIEALNFFRNGPNKNFEKLYRRQKTYPEVTCKFLLEDTDIENVASDAELPLLVNYLKQNRELTFIRGDIQGDNFQEIRFEAVIKEELSKYIPVPTSQETSQAVEVTPASEITEENENAEGEEAAPEEAEQASEKEEYGIDDIEIYFSELIKEFVFYDSFNDLLPGSVTISEITKYPAVRDFEKVFGVNFKNVIKEEPRAITREEIRLKQDASDNLNTYWTQRLEDGGKYNFSVRILPQVPNAGTDPPQTLESVSKVEFYIERDDGDPLYFEQKSKGFKWFSAFNLRLRALGVNKEKLKNLVLLIDEPGQGLHEKAQNDVKEVLEELGRDGAQIVYTTHYPVLIDTQGSKFARIRLVSNTKDTGTIVQTPAQYATGSGAKDALSPIVTAMGMHGVGSVFDSNKLNVVVEGISDHYYLTAFKKLLGKDHRLHFIPACGVTNVPNLVSVLLGWGCNYKAVFDDDKNSGRLVYNNLKKEFYENDDDLAHEHILRIKECNGIEDVFSQADFYKFVLSQPKPSKKSDPNSILAKEKKELFARLFLEKADNSEVGLSTETIKKVEEIFSWLYEKFNISS